MNYINYVTYSSVGTTVLIQNERNISLLSKFRRNLHWLFYGLCTELIIILTSFSLLIKWRLFFLTGDLIVSWKMSFNFIEFFQSASKTFQSHKPDENNYLFSKSKLKYFRTWNLSRYFLSEKAGSIIFQLIPV